MTLSTRDHEVEEVLGRYVSRNFKESEFRTSEKSDSVDMLGGSLEGSESGWLFFMFENLPICLFLSLYHSLHNVRRLKSQLVGERLQDHLSIDKVTYFEPKYIKLPILLIYFYKVNK